MKRIFIIAILCCIFVINQITSVFAWDSLITFGGPQNGTYRVDFYTPLRGTYQFSAINSKFSQPRSEGTNPHQGVDQSTNSLQLDLYPISKGKVIDFYTGDSTNVNNYLKIQLDYDRNGTYDNLYIEYWHISSLASGITYQSVVNENTIVGKTGSDHLDFRFKSNVSYPEGTYYVSISEYPYMINATNGNWNSGKDLDFICYTGFYQNIANYNIYVMNNGTKIDVPITDVKLYHRLSGQTTWNVGTFTKSGDNFSVNVRNLSSSYTSGSTVQLLVRAYRAGVADTYAWYPGKFKNKGIEPDSSYNYLNVVVQ